MLETIGLILLGLLFLASFVTGAVDLFKNKGWYPRWVHWIAIGSMLLVVALAALGHSVGMWEPWTWLAMLVGFPGIVYGGFWFGGGLDWHAHKSEDPPTRR